MTQDIDLNEADINKEIKWFRAFREWLENTKHGQLFMRGVGLTPRDYYAELQRDTDEKVILVDRTVERKIEHARRERDRRAKVSRNPRKKITWPNDLELIKKISATSYQQVAEELDCSYGSVYNYIHKHNLQDQIMAL